MKLVRQVQLLFVGAATVITARSAWHAAGSIPAIQGLSSEQSRSFDRATPREVLFEGQFRDTVVFFLDYRCAWCTVLYQDIVRPEAPFAIVVRHFAPGGIAGLSGQAAVASECSRAQGRFHPFSYALFGRRDSIGVLGWEDFARAAAVPDPAAFRECVDRREFADRVADDLALARMLELPGTPTAVHGGRRYWGWAAIAELVSVLGPRLR